MQYQILIENNTKSRLIEQPFTDLKWIIIVSILHLATRK